MQWPGGLSWVLKVRIWTKRLYEAHLLNGEGNPAKRHPWGQQTPTGSPWWPGFPGLALETPEH